MIKIIINNGTSKIFDLMDKWMNEWTNKWINEWMDGCRDVGMDGDKTKMKCLWIQWIVIYQQELIFPLAIFINISWCRS